MKNSKTARVLPPQQYVDVLLQQRDRVSWEEMKFLSDIFLEHEFSYYVCDVDRLCPDRAKTMELARFEYSLQKKNKRNSLRLVQ